MCLEELDQMGLILFSDTLELEHLFEIGIGFILNVNEVCLDKRFWW